MPMNVIDLSTLDGLYCFVESTISRTGLILRHDALYCPWAKAVAAAVQEVPLVISALPAQRAAYATFGQFFPYPTH